MKNLRGFKDPSISVGHGSMIVYPKKKYADGGSFKFNADDYAKDDNRDYNFVDLDPRKSSLANTKNLPVNLTGRFNPNIRASPPPNVEKIGDSINYGKVANDLVPFVSNAINAFRKLPNPTAPPLESPISANLVNLDASRISADNDFRNFSKETDYKVSNPSTSQAIKAVGFGKLLQSRNDVNQSEANINAGIKNQTAQFNQGVIGRNIQRKMGYNDQILSRSLKQQELNADNIADVGDKYQLQTRDKSLMNLENRKLDILPTLYKDTGVFDRNYGDFSNKERYKRFGGKLKRW